MCVIGAETLGITAAQALTANLALAAIGASAAIAGVSGIQAQQQAQAQLNQAAQAQQLQIVQQRDAQMQAALQQRQALELQQRQAQADYNLGILQANAQIQNQYEQQRQAVLLERGNLARSFEVEKQAYENRKKTAREQFKFNNEAANLAYEQEQAKIAEARKKAAFAQQTALAKSIGAKGTILSAGRTGQSVGLLVNDVERQAGFATAQQDATYDSKVDQSLISMEQAYIRSKSANNQAFSNIGIAPIMPYMPKLPSVPNFIDPYADKVAFA